MQTVGAVLAAGQSRRFGTANKLLADWQGKPLVCHALAVLSAMPVQDRAMVFADAAVAALAPVGMARLPIDGSVQSQSLKTAVRWAQARNADRLLVLLGDMPRVSHDIVDAVLARAVAGPAAASDGKRVMPPACFLRQDFDSLLAMTGDRGAGSLLKTLAADQLEIVDASLLHDVDTVADLGSQTRQGD